MSKRWGKSRTMVEPGTDLEGNDGAAPFVNVRIEKGAMRVTSNLDNTQRISVLEMAKFFVLRDAAGGGVGRPANDLSGAVMTVNRVPGLTPRRVG